MYLGQLMITIIIQKVQLTTFLDIEFLEQKAFDVCDIDDDGGLSWDEVEICEVFTFQKLDVYDC